MPKKSIETMITPVENCSRIKKATIGRKKRLEQNIINNVNNIESHSQSQSQSQIQSQIQSQSQIQLQMHSQIQSQTQIQSQPIPKSILLKEVEPIKISQDAQNYLNNLRKIKMKNTIIPWTEKYRPKNLQELVIDDISREKIKKMMSEREMPNIIITGDPGIGKTTTILCLARNLLGKNYMEGLLELNASDDRGIKAHAQVIAFCKKKLNQPENVATSVNANYYAKHKIILLDEADNMTKKSQQSISNLMEMYKENTRFAFTCNNSSDIIEAIQSRCIIFRYNKITQEQIYERLKYICKKENVKFTEDGLKAIVSISQGDMRLAINNLHIVNNSYNMVSQKTVYKLSDKPKPIIIKKILIACYKKNIHDSVILINELKDKGYSGLDILNGMYNIIKYNEIPEITPELSHYFLRVTSETYIIITQGIDTQLQLISCIIALCSHKY